MIKTEKLSKDYGDGRGILDLDLSVPEKTIFGFIGPNGSGKTTTIKLLCGLTRPDRGQASIDGLSVEPKNHVQIKRIIGFLPDEFGVYEQMSVWEYLDFFGATYKIPPKQRKIRIDEVLDVTDARHMIDYQVSSLSRGMHQKIGIAKTLLHDPKLLILDEPANGLDPYARIEMRETILRLKSMGKTILVSSHILPELGSVCDLVGIIEKGRLLTQGTVREITSSLRQNIVLEIQVAENPQRAADLLNELDCVSDLSFAGDEIRLEFTGKREIISEINEHLVRNMVKVISLRESEVDLEQVFLTVTGRKDGRDMGTAAKPGKDATRRADATPERALATSNEEEINRAIQDARSNVSDFVQAFDAPTDDQEHFAIKKIFKHGDIEDLLWIVKLTFDGKIFHGTLRNSSRIFPDLQQGGDAQVDVEDVADWMFVEDGVLKGGYTILLKYNQLDPAAQEKFLANKPYRIE